MNKKETLEQLCSIVGRLHEHLDAGHKTAFDCFCGEEDDPLYAASSNTIQMLDHLVTKWIKNTPLPSDLNRAERCLVEQGLHIDAIKLLKQRTGASLKHCKNVCDKYRNEVKQRREGKPVCGH